MEERKSGFFNREAWFFLLLPYIAEDFRSGVTIAGNLYIMVLTKQT
jgi:hypothetical protein